jgi:hypothetical protein
MSQNPPPDWRFNVNIEPVGGWGGHDVDLNLVLINPQYIEWVDAEGEERCRYTEGTLSVTPLGVHSRLHYKCIAVECITGTEGYTWVGFFQHCGDPAEYQTRMNQNHRPKTTRSASRWVSRCRWTN